MIIGVPREVKCHEYRVGLTPTSVRELVSHRHEVIFEKGAGAGIGASDAAYEKAGARIGDPWEAELVVKVKEPQPPERKKLKEGQVLFTYLHLAPDPEQTRELVQSKAICIAYETVTSARGGLPLLAPMSEVAGRMSVQIGASCLEKDARRHGHPARRRAGRAAGESHGARRRRRRLERDPHGGRVRGAGFTPSIARSRP